MTAIATIQTYIVTGWAVILSLTLLNGLFNIPIRVHFIELIFIQSSSRILACQFFFARWNCHKSVYRISRSEKERVFTMHAPQWHRVLPFSVTTINDDLVFGSLGDIAGNRNSHPDDPMLGVCFWLDFREFETNGEVAVWTRTQLPLPRMMTRGLCRSITNVIVSTIKH